MKMNRHERETIRQYLAALMEKGVLDYPITREDWGRQKWLRNTIKRHVDILSGSEYNCVHCGAVVDPYISSTNTIAGMIERLACFSCSYWMKNVEKNMSQKQVRAAGSLYWLELSVVPTTPAIYQSKACNVYFLDKRLKTVEHNVHLWANGLIPKEFEEALPNNAVLEWLPCIG
jgi:hypothetical protein